MTDPAPFGSAPRPARPGWRASVVAVVVLAAVVAGALLWHGATEQSPGTAPVTASQPGAGVGDEERDARAAALTAALDLAWDERSRARFLAAAGETEQSQRWAGEVYRNLRLLHVRDVTWRYVAARTAGTAVTSGQRAEFTGDVEVAWTPGRRFGYPPRRTSAVTVPVRFSADGEGLAILGTAPGASAPVPIWLAGPLHVVTVPGAVCVAVGHKGTRTVPEMARRAVRQIRDVIAATAPAAVVVIPASSALAGRLLGSSTADIAQIAAVTTTADGSSRPGAPVQVVLNPPVFDALGPRGAQVVLTHEVTHALTGATTSAMPLWVAEGFADFVALHDGRVPLEVAAGQILKQVRRQGPPAGLPSSAGFSASTPRLGTTYEAAWLVFRLLASRYGDPATVSFYERVRDGEPLGRTLRATFGTDVQQLTRAWRSYLDRLAGA